jgi:SOS-response transcriptional repressor LexA
MRAKDVRRDPDFVLGVLVALVEYMTVNDRAPTVRDLCSAVRWNGEKEVLHALRVLESIGAIRWPIDPDRGIHKTGGIELLVELKRPAVVPIVGYLNAAADFVPGSRWVEFHESGRVIIVKEDGQCLEALVVPS